MAKKKFRIKIDVKALLGVAVVVIGIAACVTAKYMIDERKMEEEKKKQETEAIMPIQRVYSLSEITGGKYYVKDGDSYYPVAPGILYSSASKDTAIAKIADPANRILMFQADDVTIPTMYSDSSLIFKALEGESIPQEFVLERFSDNGWTVGVRGLIQAPGGNLKTTVSNVSFYPGSSISAIKATSGNELIFDKIDGLPFGNNILSSVGTINGLVQNQAYKLDAYVGTNYVGLEAVADTHVFISMERYSLTEYSMDPSGYMIVSFPHDLWSGYYYINGVGLFRYVNQPKSMGNNVEDFNTPYYETDSNGNVTINPATGYGADKSQDKTWDYEIPIDSDKSLLDVKVTFQGSLASGMPDAKLIAPDGGEFPLELRTEDSNILATKLEFPQTGVWKLSMSSMAGRVFDVSVSFGDPVTGLLEIKKADEKQAEAKVSLPELQDATLTFTWDNTDYAGNFLIVGPNGESYGNSETPELVQEANYGRVVLHVGYMPEGDYKIYVTGKALGNVAFTYEENGTSIQIPEETQSIDENQDQESIEETEPESENSTES